MGINTVLSILILSKDGGRNHAICGTVSLRVPKLNIFDSHIGSIFKKYTELQLQELQGAKVKLHIPVSTQLLLILMQ